MGHVVVSYSSRDKEQVDLIVQAITSSGIPVWVDRADITPDKAWRAQIVRAIDTGDAFIPILSPNSITSDHVRREIDLALDSSRPIFPVVLEPVKLPRELRYHLTGLQSIDVHQLGFQESLRQLLSALNEQWLNKGG